MKREVKISQLLDVYGKVLKKSHFDALDYYYNQDLSLSELSEIFGITRQGVHDLLKRAEEHLLNLDSKLNMLFYVQSVIDGAKSIEDSAQKIVDGVINRDFDHIREESLKIINASKRLTKLQGTRW